jgi:hypothetical protein
MVADGKTKEVNVGKGVEDGFGVDVFTSVGISSNCVGVLI